MTPTVTIDCKEELDHARGRFLGILGHDLVTPLNAIWTSARVMLDNGDLHEPDLTLVREIDSSATRMHRLVADLLESELISRSQRHEHELHV